MTNAILINDLRKSIFRRKPVHGVALAAVAILLLTLGSEFLGIFAGRQASLWRFLDFLLPIIAPAFAAGTFAKEHEQRTWQDVKLTRLTAFEILSGKFFATLVPTLVSLLVLFPPFFMMLIVQNMWWAMEPGPWMIILGLKFLISATFYIAVLMVCSYHSPNTRSALVVGYVVLGVIVLLNFAFWTYVMPEFLISFYGDPPHSHSPGYATYSPYTEQYNRPWEVSNTEFSLSLVDWGQLIQSLVFSSLLFTYLAVRLRRRE